MYALVSTHMHDPVEGSAAATSAMYSPHLADIIARVVMGLPNAVGGGGGGASFSSSAVRVGGSEASSSPGNPNQWFEGLKTQGPQAARPIGSTPQSLLGKSMQGVPELCDDTPL